MMTQRQTWLDALRLFAGLSMVGLHATADATGGYWAHADVSDRVAPMLLRAVLYTARTELFLIISAFLLLASLDRRPRGYGVVIGEQARRLLIPFAFWTVFYAGYSLIKAHAFGYLDQRLEDLRSPAAWLGYVLLGDVKYHMHFIPTLFGLLLFYPLFQLAMRVPFLGLIILACLTIRQELYQFLFANFQGHEALPYLVRTVKILSYVGYGLVAGAAIGLWQRLDAGVCRSWLPIVLYIGFMLFLLKLVAIYQTIQTGYFPFTYGPGYWADFLMPVVLFFICLLLRHRNWPGWISRLAPYSFGIYLCHPIFLDFAEIGLADFVLGPMAQVGLKIVFTLMLTIGLVWIISRISGLAWVIGLGPLPRLYGRMHMKKGA